VSGAAAGALAGTPLSAGFADFLFARSGFAFADFLFAAARFAVGLFLDRARFPFLLGFELALFGRLLARLGFGFPVVLRMFACFGLFALRGFLSSPAFAFMFAFDARAGDGRPASAGQLGADAIGVFGLSVEVPDFD